MTTGFTMTLLEIGQRKNSGTAAGPTQRFLKPAPRWSSSERAACSARNADSKSSSGGTGSPPSPAQSSANHASSATASPRRSHRSSPARSSTLRSTRSSLLTLPSRALAVASIVASRNWALAPALLSASTVAKWSTTAAASTTSCGAPRSGNEKLPRSPAFPF
ncbi:Os04g0373150, partial [Oryza sativa Japonica Group]